jgi:hypothetical protein
MPRQGQFSRAADIGRTELARTRNGLRVASAEGVYALVPSSRNRVADYSSHAGADSVILVA